MLYELLVPLSDQYFFFNVFRYITFRAAYAAITAFLLALLLGPWVIARLRALGVVKHVRQEGPDSHQTKSGTPTMGGLLILAAVAIPTVLWADPANREARRRTRRNLVQQIEDDLLRRRMKRIERRIAERSGVVPVRAHLIRLARDRQPVG